jgi:PAS domain S-box-containing protein
VPSPSHDDASYRLLVEGLVDHALFMIDAGGLVRTWHQGAVKMYGYSAEEMLGRHVSALLPDDGGRAHRLEHELRQALLVGHQEGEGWHQRKDGTRFWASVIVSLLRDERGAPAGFAAFIRDHSEHHEAEAELRQREQRLRLFLDSIRDDAVFTLDPGG